MDSLSLAAASRLVTGKKVARLRREGSTPAILFGHGIEPTPLQLDAKQLREAWKTAGSSQLIDLGIDNHKSVKVLIHDVQRHPVDSSLLHVDFLQVKMTEKLETEIPLRFVGESAAVKDLEGNLITEKDVLEVRCLPADLVPEFEVDLSLLATFDDVIKVADIKVPASIEILNDPEEVVALVTAPRSEAELEELEAPVDDSEKIAELNKEETDETSDQSTEEKATTE